MGRKHSGKGRNCLLRAISPFPTVFSKDLYGRHVKTRACLGKGYYVMTNMVALSPHLSALLIWTCILLKVIYEKSSLFDDIVFLYLKKGGQFLVSCCTATDLC